MKISWMLETGGFYSSGLASFESTMTCLSGGVFFIDTSGFSKVLTQSTLILYIYGMMFLAPRPHDRRNGEWKKYAIIFNPQYEILNQPHT